MNVNNVRLILKPRAVVPNDGTITVRYAPIKDCEEFIIFKELVELSDQNDFQVGSSCWKVSDQNIGISVY